jgi:hypothetical protein
MGKNSGHPWSILKTEPAPLLHRDRTKYHHHERANRTYSHWLAGYDAGEIARFFGIETEEVERDVEHIQSLLPTRTLIGQINDRNRIVLQRAEGEKYRRLLGSALKTPVETFLAAGVSPVGPLKEFREAVGMVPERASGVKINVNQNSVAIESRPTSSEDLLRLVISRMKEREVAEKAQHERSNSGPVSLPVEEDGGVEMGMLESVSGDTRRKMSPV